MRIINNSVERAKIDSFGKDLNASRLCDLDGIELFQDASNFDPPIGCFGFVDLTFGLMPALIKEGPYEVDDPEFGDVVDYYNSLGINTHRGIYYGPDMVLSKWGRDHVYLHRLDMVPTGVGDHVRFFRVKE